METYHDKSTERSRDTNDTHYEKNQECYLFLLGSFLFVKGFIPTVMLSFLWLIKERKKNQEI